MRNKGTAPVPHIAAALSDDDVLTFRGLKFFGSHSGGGEIPVSVQDFKKHFSETIFY